MGNERATAQHIPVLDGLRGLAVLAVIVCHVNHGYGGPLMVGGINRPVAMVFGWGWVGVDLFFVLSGFLITGILYDTKDCDGYFRNFYARRALRILPLYYGSLFLTIIVFRIVSWHLPNSYCQNFWCSREDALSLALYVNNFRAAIVHGGFGGHAHFWSLAIEEHFYFLWPLAVWGLSRRSLKRMCIAAAVASILLRIMIVLSASWPLCVIYLTPCRLDGLLAGSLVALARRDGADWAWFQRNAGKYVLGSGCLLLGLALGQRHFLSFVTAERIGPGAPVDSSIVLTFGIAALSVFFSGLIVLAVDAPQASRMRRLLEKAELRAIGKYSYGIYIFHSFILIAGLQLLGPVGLESPLSLVPAFIAKPIGVVWVTAVSFGVAWVSYHLYEKRFLRLKRFFECRKPSLPAAQVSRQALSYEHA